jgi:hypothetical protein
MNLLDAGLVNYRPTALPCVEVREKEFSIKFQGLSAIKDK